MTKDFDGKVVLVTGGGTGIGRAAVLQFAAAGAAVAVADIDADAASATAGAVTEAGGRAVPITADVTSPDDSQAMVGATVAELGGLDVAFNNAGMSGAPAGVIDCTLEQWHQTLDLNLTAVFLAMKHELPMMLEAGGGSIVNTSSGAGLIGFAALPAYVASKHGVVGLTKAAALEFARQNIRVNCICPGTTRTPMIESFIAQAPELEKPMSAASPNGRMATADEIAAAAVWLSSDAASYVNGVAFPVDAGAVAQ